MKTSRINPICLLMAASAGLFGCQTPDLNLRAVTIESSSCNIAPNPKCSKADRKPTVTIDINGVGKIISVDKPELHVCRRGVITFRSNNDDFKDYGIFFSRDSKIDRKVGERGYWSNESNGELKVSMKKFLPKTGCVQYTIMRKVGAGKIEYLDPVFIVDY
jgi:hypothetical protein